MKIYYERKRANIIIMSSLNSCKKSNKILDNEFSLSKIIDVFLLENKKKLKECKSKNSLRTLLNSNKVTLLNLKRDEANDNKRFVKIYKKFEDERSKFLSKQAAFIAESTYFNFVLEKRKEQLYTLTVDLDVLNHKLELNKVEAKKEVGAEEEVEINENIII